jgi:hypothetical protein
MGVSYDDIDFFVYAVVGATKIRIYQPMPKAAYVARLAEKKKSISTCSLDADGFPLVTARFFESFVDVALQQLFDVVENIFLPDDCADFALPFHAALGLDALFGDDYMPYGDMSYMAKCLTQKCLYDIIESRLF